MQHKEHAELLQSYDERRDAAVKFIQAVRPELRVQTAALRDPQVTQSTALLISAICCLVSIYCPPSLTQNSMYVSGAAMCYGNCQVTRPLLHESAVQNETIHTVGLLHESVVQKETTHTVGLCTAWVSSCIACMQNFATVVCETCQPQCCLLAPSEHASLTVFNVCVIVCVGAYRSSHHCRNGSNSCLKGDSERRA